MPTLPKKIGYANYSLNKARKRLTTKSKKLLYSGLIHSHLVYGAPVWGSAPKCRIDKLLKQQKRAIRNIYALQYRDHTNDYFYQSKILKVPELMEHTTLCYIQSGIAPSSPEHIRQLWDEKVPTTEILRYKGKKLNYPTTSKDWINRQAPIAQAKLWNENEIDTAVKPDLFKMK